MKLAKRINKFFDFERVRLMMFHKNWLKATLEEKQEAMSKIVEDLNNRTMTEMYVGEIPKEQTLQNIQILRDAIATEDVKQREKILNHLEVCYVEDILAILKLDM